MKKIEKLDENDQETIKERLGKLTTDPAVLTRIKNYVFDQRKLENLTDFLEFGDLVKSAYPKLQDFIIGIDDPAFMFYALLFSQGQNDEKNMPMFVASKDPNDKNNQKFDYSKFFDKNSKQYENFRKLFTLLKPYVAKKVVWLPRKEDSYASVYFKEHQMLFNYSQTASFEFVFEDEPEYLVTKEEPQVTNSVFLFKSLEDNLTTLNFLNPKKVKKLREEKTVKGLLGYFLKQESNHIGRVWTEDSAESAQKIRSDDLVVSKESVQLVDKLIKESQKKAKSKFVVLSLQERPNAKKVLATFQGQQLEYQAFVSGDTYFKNNPKTVQKSEFLALPALKRVNTKTAHKAIYLEGPVLLGIKTSEIRDKNALRFIKWFTETKTWERTDSKTNKKEMILISPADYFALKSSYIPATRESILNPNSLFFENVNDFYRVSLEEVRKIVKGQDQKLTFYKEPSTALSSSIRYAIREALTNLIDPNYDFEKFIESIKSAVS